MIKIFFKINKIKCVGIVKRCIFEKQITIKSNTMEILNKEQIIEKFQNASITIKVSDCQKSCKGMIVTIHPDYGISFFSSYYCAYQFWFVK